MKKILTVMFTLLIGFTLVGCKKTKDDGAYRMAFGEAKNLNRLTSVDSSDSSVSDLLVSSFYESDYDWATAIEKGIAKEVGDFSNIKRNADDSSKEYSIDDLGYTRLAVDAKGFPKALTADSDATKENGELDVELSKKLSDTKWQVTIRQDLKFEDGRKIDVDVIEYSLKQYLSPTLLAARGNHIYDTTYLDLVNAKEYYYQKTPLNQIGEDGKEILDENENPIPQLDENGNYIYPEEVKWEDVGFRKIDDYTFEITRNTPTTQWSLMGSLSVIDLVHPEKFEAGYNKEKTRTTYGSIDNQPVSYGPYKLTSWEQDQKFTFERNEDYHNKDRYKILKIDGPVISEQGKIIEEFKAGNLDVAGVGGQYFGEFIDNPGLFITPSNSFFRLDISIDRSAVDGGKEKESAILKYPEFRQSLLVGIDREAFSRGPIAPAEPLVGYVSNIHRTKEEAAQYYNDTQQHKEVLEKLGLGSNNGYNPQLAKDLFEKAYEKAIEEGTIKKGEKAVVEYSYFDVESNQAIAKWLKSHYEGLYGTDKFEWKNNGTSRDIHKANGDAGNFDLMFSGLTGGNYMSIELMDMVYATGGFYDGKGFNIQGHKLGEVELINLYDILKETPEEKLTEGDKNFLAKVDGGVFEGTFAELYDLYKKTTAFNEAYEGRDEDLANMLAAFETALFEITISVPLFSSVGASVYSSRVNIPVPAWSERFGWGGFRYMSMNVSKK